MTKRTSANSGSCPYNGSGNLKWILYRELESLRQPVDVRNVLSTFTFLGKSLSERILLPHDEWSSYLKHTFFVSPDVQSRVTKSSA